MRLASAALATVVLSFALVATATAKPLRLTAASAVLVDGADGHVLYAHGARERRPIASTTKLMTALLTLEHMPLRRRIAAAEYNPGPSESLIELRKGERLTVADLLRGLLLASANDAAATLARGEAGSLRGFVRAMNRRARELGLRDTHYANPVGLDEPGNYSSALDLAKLARTLLRNDTFATIVDSPSATLETGFEPRRIANRNDLVAKVPWIDGVKTGHTARAGYVLVGAGNRKGVQLVSAVLGEPSEARRDADTLTLLDYGFSRYRRLRITGRGEPIVSARVSFFGGRRVALVSAQSVRLTVRRGLRVRSEVEVPSKVEGPLRAGARVGELRVFRAGRLVRAVPVVTAKAVPGAGWGQKLGRYPAWVATAAALAAIAATGHRRRGAAKR